MSETGPGWQCPKRIISNYRCGVACEPMRPPWQGRAKCLATDPALFFPERGGLAYAASAWAKAVCNGTDGGKVCPVRGECLDYALARNEPFGVWGGLSERERAKVRRERR